MWCRPSLVRPRERNVSRGTSLGHVVVLANPVGVRVFVRTLADCHEPEEETPNINRPAPYQHRTTFSFLRQFLPRLRKSEMLHSANPTCDTSPQIRHGHDSSSSYSPLTKREAGCGLACWKCGELSWCVSTQDPRIWTEHLRGTPGQLWEGFQGMLMLVQAHNMYVPKFWCVDGERV